MLSSITSIFGNIGQSNYAAANAYLNSFAEYLFSQKQNGYAMCWGPWKSVGIANDSTTLENMKIMGIHPLEKEIGKEIIIDFFKKPQKELIIADIDFSKFVKNVSGNLAPALLKNLNINKNEHILVTKDNPFEYKHLTVEELRLKLTRELRLICMKVMGYSDIDSVGADVSFRELGADSLSMFSIRSELNELLQIEMNISDLYTYATINKLVLYCMEKYFKIGDDKIIMAKEFDKESEALYKELNELVDTN